MKLPENDFQILKLTDQFYNDYPNPPYKEILEKRRRAYSCMVFQTHYDFFIAVPYRTEISHTYSYRFKTSARSRKHKSGLDYTKIVILGKTSYLDHKDAMIDRDEYKETMKKYQKLREKRCYLWKIIYAHEWRKRASFKRVYTSVWLFSFKIFS